jgi:hypothetical protein
MKPHLLLAIAILAGGCARPDPVADAPVAQNQAQPKGAAVVNHPRGAQAPAECDVRIEFGSYAMGIDRTVSAAVDRLLAEDPAIVSAEAFGQGREGEKIVCVRVRSPGDAERIARAIAAGFPADPRGPVSVTTRNGLRLSAGRG